MTRFFKDRRLQFGGLALLCVLVCVPILHTGLIGDDAFNLNIRGFRLYNGGMSLWDWLISYNKSIIANEGRFFPLMTLVQTMKFSFVQNPLTLKIAQVIAILINLATFVVLARRLSGSMRFALLAALFTLSAFQFRIFYEPFAEITIELQVFLEFLLLTAIATLRDAERPSYWSLLAVAVLWACVLADYEIGFAFIVLFPYLAWSVGGLRVARRNALVITVVALVFIAIHADIRTHVHYAAGSEYAIHPDVGAYLRTLWYQSSGAVPLNYIFYNEHHMPAWQELIRLPSKLAWISALLGASLAAWLIHESSDRPGRPAFVRVVLSALAFIVLSGALTSLSPRWQSELHAGEPYQPIYVEHFGVGLLLAALVVGIASIIGRRPTAVFGALSAFAVFFVTFHANAYALDVENLSWTYPHETFEHALRKGILARVPSGSSIILADFYPFFDSRVSMWDERYHLYGITRVHYSVYTDRLGYDGTALCAQPLSGGYCPRAKPNVYYLEQQLGTRGNATVGLTSVESFRPGQPTRAYGKDELIYTEGAPSMAPLASSSFVRQDMLYAGEGWRVAEATALCDGIASEGLRTGTATVVQYGAGFFGVEQAGTVSWNWMSARGSIDLIDSTRGPLKGNLQFDAATFADGKRLTIRGPGVNRTVLIGTKPAKVSIPISIRSQGEIALHLSTDADRPKTLGDPRDLHAQIIGLRMEGNVAACGH